MIQPLRNIARWSAKRHRKSD